MLSIHRLVQSAVQKRLGEADNVKYFDAIVHMPSAAPSDEQRSSTRYQWSKDKRSRSETVC